MASKELFGLAFVWLSLVLCPQVIGREVPKDDHMMNTTIQERSTLYLKGLIKDSSPSNFLPRDVPPGSNNHWALYATNTGEYYGTKASLNVYGLSDIKFNQRSEALIYFANGLDGPPDQLNVIQAGWHVYPELYGDGLTHFFIRWTTDGFQSKDCYNLNCEGFVRTNISKIGPGSIVHPVSTYDGKQYHVTLKILKNPVTGDWWLHCGDDDNSIPFGYWPKSLFTSLADSASQVAWGGDVLYDKADYGPPMGSGHFTYEGYGKAAYIKHIKLVDKDGELIDPRDYDLYRYNDEAHWYHVGSLTNDDSNGYMFYFGAPSGCPT